MCSVSVIVPVYNVDKYLQRCIVSILNQTYSDFELLLVDDGSSNNCGEICDEYAIKDDHIRVIHKKNGGVSSARNCGINNAKGSQVIFVDGDDTVDLDYIQNLLIVGNEDMVQGDCKVLENDYLKPFMTHEEIISDFSRYWTESGSFSCWGKCFRKQFLVDHHICFENEFDYGEDERFVMKAYQLANTIRRIKYCGYNYNTQVDNSAMKQIRWNRLMLEQDICQRLEQCIVFFDSKMRIRWIGWHYVLNHYYHFFSISVEKKEKRLIKKKIIEAYRSEFFQKSATFIKKNGSLDEKVEAYLMGYHRHKLFLPIMRLIQILSSIKRGGNVCRY